MAGILFPEGFYLVKHYKHALQRLIKNLIPFHLKTKGRK